LSKFVKLPQECYPFGIEEHEYLVGIWINKSGVGHVGIVYLCLNDEGDVLDPPVKELHLIDHEVLLDKPIDLGKSNKQYLMAPLKMKAKGAERALCAYLNLISKNAPKIAYGIDWIGAHGSFNDKGEYLPNPMADGMTCATFVAEALIGGAFKPVQPCDWPKNEKASIEWRDDMVKRLTARNVTKPEKERIPQHVIDAIRDADPVVRITPAEIGAACVLPESDWKVTHASVAPHAAELISLFDTTFPSR